MLRQICKGAVQPISPEGNCKTMYCGRGIVVLGVVSCVFWLVLTEVHGEAGRSFQGLQPLPQMYLQQVGNQQLLIKPCSSRYLLPDDNID